jgi:general secretion pathway protein L
VKEALLLFLGRDGGIEGWLRAAGGAVAARGAARELPPPDRSRAVTAIVPGEQVTLHWMAIPSGLSPAQEQGAARIMAAEASAQPIADMHVAVGREEESGLRCIALVPAATMAGWLAAAREARLEPEVVVPDTLLLPVPEEGFTRFERDGVSLYRGKEAAFALEPELAALVLNGAPVQELDVASFEAALPEAAERPLVNLRQGHFARRRELRLERGRVRRLALLAAALLLATLAVHVGQILRYTFATDALEEETRRLASAALPKGGTRGNPSADLDRRLAELRGGGLGFGATSAAVFGAVRATPNVELAAVAFGLDGVMRITAQADSAASLADFAGRVEASGFRVERSPPRVGAGRQVQDMVVRPR